MQRCGICTEDLQTPVALPCGHVFCDECVLRAIDAIKPYSTLHSCPTCRSTYSTAHIDIATIPSHLRPHISTSVRKLRFDESIRAPRTISSAMEIAVENGRLNAENSALRTNCEMWRKRAEVHSTTTLGLLRFAHLARDEVGRLKQERDELQRCCDLLNKRFAEIEPSLQVHPQPSLSKGDRPPLPPLPTKLPYIFAPPSVPDKRPSRPGTPVSAQEIPRPRKRTRGASPTSET